MLFTKSACRMISLYTSDHCEDQRSPNPGNGSAQIKCRSGTTIFFSKTICAAQISTPIAMPGWASLLAAVQPADTRALYFVARGDGSSHFSESLDEHNDAVRRYILKR